MLEVAIIPRFIRMRDAPKYLGMDKNRFSAEVRPFITEIPIGSQGIAFDRLDLDAWADQYKAQNAIKRIRREDVIPRSAQPASRRKVTSGTSTNRSETSVDYVKVLAQLRSKNREKK